MKEIGNLQIFFGFPTSVQYRAELNDVSQPLLDAFISADDSYLQFLSNESGSYLGKMIEAPVSLDSLESQKDHIISLLRRLVPHYTYKRDSFVLWAINDAGRV